MNWKILPKKFDDLVLQLLFNRGLKAEKEIQQFFHSDFSSFEKDLEIPGIPKATARIQKAVENQELIIAYGDYDVDGIAGAAILYQGLTSVGAKVLPYIPHREKEGYGLSKLGLEFARDSGATVVVTTDIGIVAFEMANFAKELGLDLIITDHHQPQNKKYPNAFAIVHSIALCGAAVSWCLIKNLVSKKVAEDLLDFVSLATISDMMPLIGLNRVLVSEGLKKLNTTERVGWLALFREANLTLGKISAYEVGHIIAPRLNAMGRLEHAIDSLRLLCTKDPSKAKKLADLVGQTNEERKLLTLMAVEEALKMVKASKKNIHILSSNNWSPGIIGLIAGRICDETGLGIVVISKGIEYSKGSARSKAINIVELLRECEDLLEAVGGHSAAAGFTIKTKNIPQFQKRLESLTSRLISKVSLGPTLGIEAMVKAKELNLGLLKKLDNFEPFGVGNPEPILATSGMKLSDLRTVGEGKHLKGKVEDIDFIAFGMGNMLGILANDQLVDLAYTVEWNRFNGSEKLQLKVKDLKIT